MSLFSDIFQGGYSDAANAQITGLNSAYTSAVPNINAGTGVLNTDYAAALAPFTALGTTASAGTTALANALGLGGAAGTQSALKTLEATPGYQFSLQQGEQAVDRGAAAKGMLTSGNTTAAEDQYAQGLAQQTYNSYVSQLEPYLGVAENAAAGTAGVDTGLGTAVNANDQTLGNLAYNTQAGIGNANASADLAEQNAVNSFISGAAGLGTKLLGYGAATGFGGLTTPNPVGGAILGGNPITFSGSTPTYATALLGPSNGAGTQGMSGWAPAAPGL
jgi:hypothetical protein